MADKARAAGYRVTVQEFPFVFFVELVEEAREVSPTERDLEPDAMTYSPPTPVGGITAPVAVVPKDADTGCTASDFASQSYTGTIAFMRRGGCTFAIKAANAADAGAVAAVIVNNIPGPLAGTLTSPENATIPVVGVAPELGDPVIADAAAGPTTVFLNLQTIQEDSVSYNVLAETRSGNPNNVVVVGSISAPSSRARHQRQQLRLRRRPRGGRADAQGEAAQQGPVRVVGGGGVRSRRLRLLRRKSEPGGA